MVHLMENEQDTGVMTEANGSAWIMVDANSVAIEMLTWDAPNVNVDNPVIGLHLHEGNSSESGPILVGFCGQSPLPAFSGPCPLNTQSSAADVTVQGQALGDATLAAAAEKISSSGASVADRFYLNFHTDMSPSGLIRGQLQEAQCPGDATARTTTVEDTSVARNAATLASATTLLLAAA
jgi:hypothetical protein